MAFFRVVHVRSTGQPFHDFAQSVLKHLRSIRGQRARGSTVLYREGNPWIVVDGYCIPLELSRDFNTEAILLDGSTVVDGYLYKHFVEGKLRRELCWCRDGKGWESVKGKPEPWETELLFADQERDLAYLKDTLAKTADPKERRSLSREIEAMKNRKIVAGNYSPSFSTNDVGQAYGLPGFGPETLQPSAMRNWWSFQETV